MTRPRNPPPPRDLEAEIALHFAFQAVAERAPQYAEIRRQAEGFEVRFGPVCGPLQILRVPVPIHRD
jgi:hypothetical protein